MSDQIRQAIARAWCAAQNANKPMDSTLAIAIANEVTALVASATQQGEVNGAMAMRKLAEQVAHDYEVMDSDEIEKKYDCGHCPISIRNLPLPTPISDYLTAQLTEARAAQRESDAQLAHKEWACPNVAAAIRANLTPADAQYIERVRAKAALEEAKIWDGVFPSDWSDERISQLSQQAGIPQQGEERK